MQSKRRGSGDMAVLIDMEMPKSCYECRMTDDRWCYAMQDDDMGCTSGTRPENCPLIELTDGLYQVQDEKIWKYQGKGKR